MSDQVNGVQSFKFKNAEFSAQVIKKANLTDNECQQLVFAQVNGTDLSNELKAKLDGVKAAIDDIANMAEIPEDKEEKTTKKAAPATPLVDLKPVDDRPQLKRQNNSISIEDELKQTEAREAFEKQYGGVAVEVLRDKLPEDKQKEFDKITGGQRSVFGWNDDLSLDKFKNNYQIKGQDKYYTDKVEKFLMDNIKMPTGDNAVKESILDRILSGQSYDAGVLADIKALKDDQFERVFSDEKFISEFAKAVYDGKDSKDIINYVLSKMSELVPDGKGLQLGKGGGFFQLKFPDEKASGGIKNFVKLDTSVEIPKNLSSAEGYWSTESENAKRFTKLASLLKDNIDVKNKAKAAEEAKKAAEAKAAEEAKKAAEAKAAEEAKKAAEAKAAEEAKKAAEAKAAEEAKKEAEAKAAEEAKKAAEAKAAEEAKKDAPVVDAKDDPEVKNLLADLDTEKAANDKKLTTFDEKEVKEVVNKSDDKDAVLQYYYAPISNIFADVLENPKKVSNEDGQKIMNAISEVANLMAKTEDGLVDMKTARNLTLSEIDDELKTAKEALASLSTENPDEAEDIEQWTKVHNAYANLKDVVMEYANLIGDGKLRIEEPPKEEHGALYNAAAATGEAVWDGVKFVTKDVLRVGDAREGAKNAGKRVEAQYKQNGVISGLVSTVGNTGSLATSAASGALGVVTDGGEAITDAVDNMEEGYIKDAAKTGSGVIKAADGIVNLGAAAVDGVGHLLKNGLYINKLWGGDDNDEAVNAEVKGAIDNIIKHMQTNPLTKKEDETDEEFAARQAQEKVEYSYITDITHILGVSKADLEKMDADDARELLVKAINNEKIPLDIIKAFAPKKIAEQGLKEQSKLLTTDAAEAKEKASKGVEQIVDGIADTATGAGKVVGKTVGALFGYGWAWGDDDDEVKAAEKKPEVHTASSREITQAERDKQIAEWKKDFTPKFEENKKLLLDSIVPPEFVAGAVEGILESNYDVENMTQEDLDKTKAAIKRELYEKMGNELEKKFSDFEAHRLFQRSLNEAQFGEDTFWTGFWNEIDKVKDQENTAGDRGFWKNAGSYLAGILKFPATAVLTDAPYTIAGVAGGIPFWQYQVAFSLFLGSDEHMRGTENIIKGKFNSAQKAAGWDENGYATVKDIVVWWTKHEAQKVLAKKPDPKPQPEPKPEPVDPDPMNHDPETFDPSILDPEDVPYIE